MSETLLKDAVRLHQAGQLGEAARLYGAILRASPRNFEALYFLGFLHSQRGEFVEADRLMAEALRINPRSPDAHYNRGCAQQVLQRHTDALVSFEKALALKPNYSDASTNRGVALMALRRPIEALAAFDTALAINPNDAEALSNRGTVLFQLKRYDEAAANYESLLTLDPNFRYALGTLVLSRAYCCDWRFAQSDLSSLHAAMREGREVLPPHGATLISSDPEDQLLSARAWTSSRCRPQGPPLWRGERYRHDRIRVAYLSADFHDHATAHLMAGVFEHHDRKRFETVAISFGPDDKSTMRNSLVRSFERFVDVQDRSDAETATLLRNMEIDIAVDLKGFTDGSRPGILVWRPAPVQVNYLGHPGTMGADFIDYIIADRTVIPERHRAYYREKVVHLPDSYQCNDNKRSIAVAPSRTEAGLPERGFVFASFNNSFKITPEVFAIWTRLLHAAPQSVLWLLDANGSALHNLRREAEARGIEATRLIFAPLTTQREHLTRQRLADLFLDTLPCNAHTTASDALWAGLPLLTCLGSTFAGRVAASLLKAVELDELVTPALEAYESMALKLATDA